MPSFSLLNTLFSQIILENRSKDLFPSYNHHGLLETAIRYFSDESNPSFLLAYSTEYFNR